MEAKRKLDDKIRENGNENSVVIDKISEVHINEQQESATVQRQSAKKPKTRDEIDLELVYVDDAVGNNNVQEIPIIIEEASAIEIANEEEVIETQQVDDNVNLFDKLDDDMLYGIFLKLPIRDRVCYERVSKKWQTVSQRPWIDIESLDLEYEYTWSANFGWDDVGELYPEKCALEKILSRCGGSVKRLEIIARHAKPEINIIPLITKYCNNIQVLCINLKKYRERELQQLFAHCGELRVIEIYNVGGKFTGKCLQKLPKDKINTVYLESSVKDKCFFPPAAAAAIRELYNLETLSLCQFSFHLDQLEVIMENYAFKHFSLTGSAVMRPLPTTEDTSYFDVNEYLVTDTFLRLMGDNCTQLRHLDLSNTLGTTDHGLHAVFTLPHLETLYLTSIPTIDGGGFGDMVHLKLLDCTLCTNVDDDGIVDLIKNAKSLEVLKLEYTQVTLKTLRIAEKITRLRTNELLLKIYVCAPLRDAYMARINGNPSPLLKVCVSNVGEEMDNFFSDDDIN